MKHWLNNWEKVIGKRLKNAKNQPESYIWDLIEQELDATASIERRGSRRIIAALIALLLVGSGIGFLFISPSAQSAFSGHDKLILPEINQWAISEGQDLQAGSVSNTPEESYTVRGDVSEFIIEGEAMDPAQEDVAIVSAGEYIAVESIKESTAKVELELQKQFNSEIELNTEMVANARINSAMNSINNRSSAEILGEQAIADFADASNDAEAIRRLADQMLIVPVESDQQMNFIRQTEDIQLKQTELPSLSEGISPYQELLDRIAQHSRIENQILVRKDGENSEDLHVHQNISQLSGASLFEGLSNDNAMIGSDDNLVMDNELLAYKAADIQREEIQEIESEVIQKADWVQEVFNELETWKASLQEQDEEFAELQELIEEAEIDEEDPLTKRQMEAKDLYRAHNINKGFHIGLITAYQNTWVTKASRNPEVDRSIAKHKYKPGYQVGLNMGYDFTNHFGLMMEFKYSGEGGRYYNPLKDREQQMDLTYIEIPIYAKIKHSKLTQKMRPIVFNYLVGITYSDLRQINVSDGGVDKRFGQDYNTTEWGISAGFDFDFYINKNFFWTVGTRAGVSGNSKSFPRFKGSDGNGAMSIDTGIYTRLNFRLPGK